MTDNVIDFTTALVNSVLTRRKCPVAQGSKEAGQRGRRWLLMNLARGGLGRLVKCAEQSP